MQWGDQRIPDSIWARVIPLPITGCWIWLGAMSGTDQQYGFLTIRSDGEKRNQVAHRFFYEALVGPLPPFRRTGNRRPELDHRCRVPCCVNPDHVELVSCQVNTLRSTNLAAANAQKDECPKGHKYSPENTRVIRFAGREARRCIECTKERDRIRGLSRPSRAKRPSSPRDGSSETSYLPGPDATGEHS